jgi:hypothetical protein
MKPSMIVKYSDRSPEEIIGANQIINVEEEEKILMSGVKNLENKDDFWISLWEQL